MKVRIKATEVVRYDQIVEMSEDDFARLQEAVDIGEDAEVEWLVRQSLEVEEIDCRMNFVLAEHFACDVNGKEIA